MFIPLPCPGSSKHESDSKGEDDDFVDAWECEEGGESEDEKVDDPAVECENEDAPADDTKSSPTVESQQDPLQSSKVTDPMMNNVTHADAHTESKDLTTMVLAIESLLTDFWEGRLSKIKNCMFIPSKELIIILVYLSPSLHRMLQRRLRALRLWPLQLPWKALGYRLVLCI